MNRLVVPSKSISTLQWICSKASPNPVDIVCDMVLYKYVLIIVAKNLTDIRKTVETVVGICI